MMGAVKSEAPSRFDETVIGAISGGGGGGGGGGGAGG